ncbi:MAG: tRNA adenosine(34) deaminase TadA [Bacillota bacterium]
MRHEQGMELALAEARKAYDRREVPIGAVVVLDDQVVGRGHNLREFTGDPTAHAEMVAIREAARAMGSWRLENTVMYVTLEPCPMCAGALILARVRELVYGAPDPKAGACGSLMNIVEDSRFNHRLSVTPGIMAGACAELIQRFFRELRE